MLTKEEEAEIDQQAEDMKQESNADIGCLFLGLFYAIAIGLIIFKGVVGWYFLLGGFTTTLLTGLTKYINKNK